MKDLARKVAVVTGGASGIGRAMAKRFVAEGMQVVIADIEEAPLAATAGEIGAVGVRTNVTDADSVAALAQTTMERFGAVHVLCNNAGVGGGGKIKDLTLKDWKWVIDVNLWGVIHGLHFFLPHLLASSDGGQFGVVAISETLRAELAAERSPIHVSVLCPGYVDTNIFTSQRNRPAELRNERPKGAARVVNRSIASEALAHGLDPAVVAGMVVDAIRSEQFWVLTHPEYHAAITERAAGIVAEH
jgi:NAD(P)-dependent dehydrogenase (short-subunit alcohol dehydrogenase family)